MTPVRRSSAMTHSRRVGFSLMNRDSCLHSPTTVLIHNHSERDSPRLGAQPPVKAWISLSPSASLSAALEMLETAARVLRTISWFLIRDFSKARYHSHRNSPVSALMDRCIIGSCRTAVCQCPDLNLGQVKEVGDLSSAFCMR